MCGAIGFVGLIAPYAARRISGGHPGRALVPAALIGAILLLARRSCGSLRARGTDHPGGDPDHGRRHATVHLAGDRHAAAADVMTPLLKARGVAINGRLWPTDLDVPAGSWWR